MNKLEELICEIGQSFLLAIMDRNELLYIARQRIKTEDFYTKTERDVWSKILKLDKELKGYDVDSICNVTYVDDINANDMSRWKFNDDLNTCSISYFKDRVDDFVNLVDRNRMFKQATQFSDKVFNGDLKSGTEIAEQLANLTTKAYKLHPVHDTRYAGETILEDLAELGRISKHGMDFGINSIDGKLGKMVPGDMIIVTARPGIGKSSIMLYAVDKYCKSGKHVCINTLEMSRQQVMLRYVAKQSIVMMDRITGVECPSQDEIMKIADATDVLKKLKLTVKEQGLHTVSEIDSFLTMCAAQKNPVELFVIDHFGLLKADGKTSGNRATDYTYISNEIKRLAKKHKCVMLVLAQLNRMAKEELKPCLNDLRDTGSLEQDADKVIAMWRENVENKTIGVGVLKNRNGQIFETKLQFYPSTMQYYELSYNT